MAVPVPNKDQIASTLENLLGRNVSVTEQPLPSFSAADSILASYIFDNTSTAAVAVFDFSLGINIAASLTMIPASSITAEIHNKQANDNTLDNLGEICNILSQLFNSQNSPHTSFKRLFTPETPALPDILALINAPAGGAQSYSVSIEGYGTGILTCYCA